MIVAPPSQMMAPLGSLLANTRPSLIFAASLSALLIATWLIYCVGLNGSYLFDDFNHLNALGITGPVQNWPSFVRFITSGTADPTGRPLTLLSFLVDAQDWPADPWAFKRTNLMLHLLNGALLCWVMLLLSRAAGLIERHGRSAALLGTAIWLLHPLFVSTILYIVQREAMLPATFTFCGLLCWCKGRSRLEDAQVMSAWFLMATGSVLCTLLAMLCKANGALLPLLIATAELTVLRTAPSRRLRTAHLILLALPVLLLLLGLVAEIPTAVQIAAESRPWTIGQRLLTEPRVFVDYLRLLWLPRATSFGVFNDQFQASRDLLHPWTTLPCLFAVVALGVLAWLLRLRRPIFAFAIMFYIAGQLMESTFLPLELAFEHRNYLPAAFMFWPLGVWLTGNNAKPQKFALTALIVGGLTVLTWSRCQVWGNPREQALIWGRVNPDSPRAQAFAAAVEMDYGDSAAAIERLRDAAVRMPDDVQITLNLVDAECRTGVVTPATWSYVLHSLEYNTNGARAAFNWFTTAIHNTAHHACKGLTLDDMTQALHAAENNRKFGHRTGNLQDYAHIEGLIALAKGQGQTALEDFNRALIDAPDRGTTLAQAAALGVAGYPDLGLQHLDFAEVHPQYAAPPLGMARVHSWLLNRQRYWEHETKHLRAVLSTDAATKAAKNLPAPTN